MSVNINNYVKKLSKDIKEDRIDALKRSFPEVFVEGKVDFEKLKLILGEEIDERPERFNFTWAGKNNAIKNVLIPSKATLKPAKEESVKFDESENLIIEGDNLEVLKLLQKTYFGKVKMIYIDPPYNTGGDFVYHDDYSAPINSYLKQTGQLDDEGNKQSSNKETNGRYHSDWLSMMYPRLKLAWNLLKDDGVIFISIDDNELHNLRKIVDEVFGEENFIETLVWKKRTTAPNDRSIGRIHEYILCYAKTSKVFLNLIPRDEKSKSRYSNPDNDIRGSWVASDLNANGKGGRLAKTCLYPIHNPVLNKDFFPSEGKCWLFNKEKMDTFISEGRVAFRQGSGAPFLKRYLNEVRNGVTLPTILNDFGNSLTSSQEIDTIFQKKGIFEFPKPTKLIKALTAVGSDNNGIVLDFFAGSGTTAQAVLELNKEDGGNRKFILVQLPEKTDIESEAFKAGYKTITDITKERVKKTCADTGFKVFKLSQSNYPEISFEFDPEKTEEENKTLLTAYLSKAKQTSLLESSVNPIDVVYENIVKEGFSLSSKVEEGSVDGNHLFIVTDGDREMRISLDSKISPESVKKLSSVEFKGKTFVCYDNALTDSDKANISLNLELKTI